MFSLFHIICGRVEGNASFYFVLIHNEVNIVMICQQGFIQMHVLFNEIFEMYSITGRPWEEEICNDTQRIRIAAFVCSIKLSISYTN
jgi:hypothetical protein